MLPPRLREKLRDSILHCGAERMCVLCHMPLQAYRDDVPCLHWMLLSGKHAFCPARLQRIFDHFDVGMAVDYLRIVAMADRSGRGVFELRDAGYAIWWRRRQWVFTREPGMHSHDCLLTISGRRKPRMELRIVAICADFDALTPDDASPHGN